MNKIGERDTRRLVEDVLIDMLDWNKHGNITDEAPIAGGNADFALRKECDAIAIIELKKVTVKRVRSRPLPTSGREGFHLRNL